MDYQLELKQIVDYLRRRIYREFLHSLMEDRDIRTNGCSSFLLHDSLFLCQLPLLLPEDRGYLQSVF